MNCKSNKKVKLHVYYRHMYKCIILTDPHPCILTNLKSIITLHVANNNACKVKITDILWITVISLFTETDLLLKDKLTFTGNMHGSKQRNIDWCRLYRPKHTSS